MVFKTKKSRMKMSNPSFQQRLKSGIEKVKRLELFKRLSKGTKEKFSKALDELKFVKTRKEVALWVKKHEVLIDSLGVIGLTGVTFMGLRGGILAPLVLATGATVLGFTVKGGSK